MDNTNKTMPRARAGSETDKMIRSMSHIGTMLTGRKVVVRRIEKSNDMGYHIRAKNGEYISINFDWDFTPRPKEDGTVLLYGLFTHEIMHALRTDSEYTNARIREYPAEEQYDRHELWNIMEDPAIEYLSQWEVSDTLYSCLQQLIRYLYEASPALEECGNDAYTQYIAAMIMFGDVGFLKGTFTFPEAAECFRKTAPAMLEIVEEPDAQKRFEMSQDVFETVRPLWEKHQEQLLPKSALKKVLDSFGVISLEGDASPVNNDEFDPDTSKDPNMDNRKSILQLLEDSGEGRASGDAGNAASGSGDPSSSEGSEDAQASGTVGGQQESSPVGADAAAGGSDGPEGTQQSAGSQDGKQQSAGSQDGKQLSVGSQDGKQLSAGSQGDNQQPAEGQDGTQKAAGDPAAAQASHEGQESKDGIQKPTAEKDGSDQTKNPDAANPLIRALAGLSRQLGQEFHDSSDPDLVRALSGVIKKFMNDAGKETNTEKKKQEIEDVYVDVRSPYFREARYNVVKPSASDSVGYNEMKDALHSNILNFRAQLRKIFNDNYSKKEYGVNGKLCTERLCGRKVTARIFQKNRKPDDKTDMAVVIMLDLSGSMRTNMDYVKKACVLIMESFAEFQIPVKIVGFFTSAIDSYDATYYHFGEWKNSRDVGYRMMTAAPSGKTFLGHAIRYGGALLKKRPEKHRLFIMITDGKPCSNFYKSNNDGMNDCRYAVTDIRKYAKCIGLGLYGNEAEEKSFRFIFGRDGTCVTDISELVKDLPKLIKKAIQD